MCGHEHVHRTEGRLDRETGILRFFFVCDTCEETLGIIEEMPYAPNPVALMSPVQPKEKPAT